MEMESRPSQPGNTFNNVDGSKTLATENPRDVFPFPSQNEDDSMSVGSSSDMSGYYNQQPVVSRPPVSDDFQKQIQQDWANREYIEVISGSIKRIADFLNSFDLSCRNRLAQLNERLTNLERTIEALEAWISKGETLS